MSLYRIREDKESGQSSQNSQNNQNSWRVGNYVGIAQKAGKIAAGDAAATAALKAGKGRLLLLAQDTAPAVSAELLALAEAGQVPVLYWPDKASLGLLVGKSRRGALALLDEGFAQAILKLCAPFI